MLNPTAPAFVPVRPSTIRQDPEPCPVAFLGESGVCFQDPWNESAPQEASSVSLNFSQQWANAEHNDWNSEPRPESTAPGRWGELPQELVIDIARRVSERSQAAMRVACKAWAPDVSQAVVHLGLAKPEVHFFDRHMRVVCDAFPCLRWLELYGCHSLTEGAIRSVQGLSRLEGLKVVNCDNLARSAPAWIPYMQHMERLTKLAVAIRSQGIERMGCLTRLNSLELIQVAWTQHHHLRSLQHLTGLQTLTLTGFRGLKDWEIIGALANMKQLHALSLAGCYQLSIKTLVELPKLPNLRALNLSVLKRMTFAGLDALTGLTALHTLDLGFCPAITDQGALHLQPLTQLYNLVLAGCANIGDEGVEGLTALTNLHSLNISKCGRVTDAGFLKLTSLLSLVSLNALECPQITAAAAVELSWHVQILLAPH